MDHIAEASALACDIWNARNRHYPITFSPNRYSIEGNVIYVDGVLSFCRYTEMEVLDGHFIVGNNTSSWDDPMEFVYGFLECFDESFHLVYENPAE